MEALKHVEQGNVSYRHVIPVLALGTTGLGGVGLLAVCLSSARDRLGVVLGEISVRVQSLSSWLV